MSRRPTFRLARTLQRTELARLRSLGAVVTALPAAKAQAALFRFAHELVDAPRLPAFLAAAEAARDSSRQLDYARWFPPEATSRGGAHGCLSWLCGPDAEARCLRFDPRVALGAMELCVASFEDVWVASWPGLYVHFRNQRAFFVDVDYEITRCDMRAGRASPYR